MLTYKGCLEGQAANMRFEFFLYFISVLELYLCGHIYLWLPGLFIKNGLVFHRSQYKVIILPHPQSTKSINERKPNDAIASVGKYPIVTCPACHALLLIRWQGCIIYRQKEYFL
jgi:hypothetical protein